MLTQVIRSSSEMPSIEISIVIPTFNRVSDLIEALVALKEQSLRDFEVIIVDNGPSEDDTRKQTLNCMQQDKRITYISTTEKGAFVARNIGCAHARAELILTTDDDWKMTNPHTLKYIVQSFRQTNSLGVLGISEDYSSKWRTSPLWKRRLRKLSSFLYKPGRVNRWGRVTARYFALPVDQKIRVDHVRSCCMAFRREAAEKVGFFPTLYVTSNSGIGYRSETELCRKLAKMGYEIVISSEIVGRHKASTRPNGVMPRSQTLEKMRYQARNHMLFTLRNYWSRLTSPVFFAVDLLVGNRSQPGLARLVTSLRYFGKVKIVFASLRGKWEGFFEYHSKYHDLRQCQ